ncbi:fungal cellulose binding domain-containing protein [Seiridium cupressi]
MEYAMFLAVVGPLAYRALDFLQLGYEGKNYGVSYAIRTPSYDGIGFHLWGEAVVNIHRGNPTTAYTNIIQVEVGSDISAIWRKTIDRTTARPGTDDVIDPSHKRFKIQHDGYNGGKWDVENLISNAGKRLASQVLTSRSFAHDVANGVQEAPEQVSVNVDQEYIICSTPPSWTFLVFTSNLKPDINMKSFIQLAAVALFAHCASAHYIFTTFSPGTSQAAAYQYVRQNTNNNSPVTDLASNDLRCNVGGATGGSTSTIEVAAGSPFTFTLDQAVYHQGPVSLYMSKAPTTAASYDGSGDWFKTFDCTVPRCIPAGEYLVRIQSLAIHNPGSTPQFYISCAQVKVTGGGSTTPSSKAKIPGFIKSTDPGYTANSQGPQCSLADPDLVLGGLQREPNFEETLENDGWELAISSFWFIRSNAYLGGFLDGETRSAMSPARL